MKRLFIIEKMIMAEEMKKTDIEKRSDDFIASVRAPKGRVLIVYSPAPITTDFGFILPSSQDQEAQRKKGSSRTTDLSQVTDHLRWGTLVSGMENLAPYISEEIGALEGDWVYFNIHNADAMELEDGRTLYSMPADTVKLVDLTKRSSVDKPASKGLTKK